MKALQAMTISAAVLLGVFLLFLPAGSVSATVILSNWNVQELNGSGDYVSVMIGDDGDGNATLTVQWVPGASNELTALGIDKLYYNCIGCGPFSSRRNDDESGEPGAINAVWLGTDDVTSAWKTHFGGDEADGFGSFSSLGNQDSAGTGGITDPLIFVLNGMVTNLTVPLPAFYPNSQGGTFAVHVRYENDCSGWASNGSANETESEPNCVAVPEPSSVALLGIGLFALAGSVAWRRRRASS